MGSRKSSDDPRDNLRVTFGQLASDSLTTSLIPGLGETSPPSRSVELCNKRHTVIDHTQETYDTVDIPDHVLYRTSLGREDGPCKDNSGYPCKDNSGYLRQIEMEYHGIKVDPVSPVKDSETIPESLEAATSPISSSSSSSFSLVGYEDVDFSKLPPLYTRLLKFGCTEEIAELFLNLVDEGMLGEVDWERDHAKETLKNIAMEARRNEDRLKSFLQECQEMPGTHDKFLFFKRSYFRYLRGYKPLQVDAITPLEPHIQIRLEQFYEGKLARGYRVYIKQGYRKFCREDNEDDTLRELNQIIFDWVPAECFEDSLVEFFSRAGEIEDLTLIMGANSSRHRKFGFVNYASTSQADMAMATLSNAELTDGKKMSLSWGCNHSTLLFTGLPRHVSEVGFKKCFRAVFKAVSLVVAPIPTPPSRYKNKGYVFVTFEEGSSARRALKLTRTGSCEIAGVKITDALWARPSACQVSPSTRGQTGTKTSVQPTSFNNPTPSKSAALSQQTNSMEDQCSRNPQNVSGSSSDWQWSTGKRKKKSHKSERVRSSESERVRLSESSSVWPEIPSEPQYLKSIRQASSSATSTDLLKKFTTKLDENKRLQAKADVLDFFGIEDPLSPEKPSSSKRIHKKRRRKRSKRDSWSDSDFSDSCVGSSHCKKRSRNISSPNDPYDPSKPTLDPMYNMRV